MVFRRNYLSTNPLEVTALHDLFEIVGTKKSNKNLQLNKAKTKQINVSFVDRDKKAQSS